jgi:hypothetical protein
MKETLKNEKTCIEYRDDEKQIFGRDLIDQYNDPAFYTKSKRGLKAAWTELEKTFTPETSMHDVIRFMIDRNIKTHYWCMVD